ncbi:MAG: ABC transporter ATP-binding protein [Candidatus Enterosoma sp.]|nr:ABC transporter ATP-binding protein [bacterium]MDY5866393.1 ABC transporter ATP-binding protein [Candidatus Enterosoma sp.]
MKRSKKIPADKEKINIKEMMKVLKKGKKFLPAMIIASVLAIVSSVIAIISPQRLSTMVDIIQEGIRSIDGINFNTFLTQGIILLVFFITMAACSYAQQFIMADITQKMSYLLRKEINEKIDRLPLSFFDKNTVGDIISRVTNDVDTISQTLGSAVATMLEAVVMFFGVLIMMFVTNWLLALVSMGASILGFVIVSIVITHSEKYFKRRQKNLGEMNGRIQEDFSNIKIITAFNAKEYATEKFSAINKELRKNNKNAMFLNGSMMPLMNFVGNLSYALVFIIGIAISLTDSSLITFGMITSFTIYARLFSQPLQSVAQSMSSLQQTSAASSRVFGLLEEKEMENEDGKTATIENVIGDVRFEHVNFSYTPEKEIIKDFNASLKAGMKVAIVGPTGAGKTTMVNLLMRFYEVNKGKIYIDGVSIDTMRRETVHSLFDMILQDTWLFAGTIRENLIFNKEGVEDEHLYLACKAVGLASYIDSLKDGFDTVIDPTLLSEGQKQQLTIARALIENAPLLILDEATSSVDTRTEIKIQEAMDRLTKGRTSFVIAHRLSTIRNADVILVMKDGDIIEQGNHQELLKKNGFYASLYNSQFETV